MPPPTPPILLTTLLALTAAAAARQTTTTTTTTILIPDSPYPAATVTGSIVSANPTATTVSLFCQPDEECGLFPTHQVIFGPKIWSMDMADHEASRPDFTATMNCPVVPSNLGERVVCTEMASGEEANFPGTSTTTYEFEEVETMVVVVTEGVEKLGAGGAEVTGSVATKEENGGSRGSVKPTTVAQGTGTETGVPTQSGSEASGLLAPEETGASAADKVVLGRSLVGAAAIFLGGVLL